MPKRRSLPTAREPLLFGVRAATKSESGFLWNGRGYSVEVYRTAGTWSWHLCVSHANQTILDKRSFVAQSTQFAALRSVAAVIRTVRRALTNAMGES